jgi:hypothetical protein
MLPERRIGAMIWSVISLWGVVAMSEKRIGRGCRMLAVLGAVLALASAARTDEGRTFAHPERIRYDGHCLTIEGKDMMIYSGAFHYFRCPKELWHDRFVKIKEAGFNTVETYIAWNRCEVDAPAGLNDFSKVHLQDVEDWLNMAEEAGLYVIIRPGPYICAEWDRGGLPGWLATKKPANPKESRMWFRSDDPEFIAWSRHWYDAVCPLLAKHQITRKKPGEMGIIMFQLENEYDFSGFSAEIKNAYVKALGQAAAAKGIDVPMFTCWTGSLRGSKDPVLRQVFDSCNFYPGWDVVGGTKDRMEELRKEQPDAPMMTTELQGGWFVGVGDEPPIKPDVDNYRHDLGPAQITNLTLFTYQHGETITNYYMLFGGTNMEDGAAQNIATCYDYSCPIRENGGVGEKYLRVKALGEFVREHGARLARTEAIEADVKADHPDVTVVVRQAMDGGRYYFVRTNQHGEPRKGTARVTIKAGQVAGKRAVDAEKLEFQYELEPFGAKVMYEPAAIEKPKKMEWWPREQPAIERPTELPTSVAITEVMTKADGGPREWKTLAAGEHLNEAGVYDSGFVFYKDKLRVKEDELKDSGSAGVRASMSGGDQLVGLVNGHRAGLAEGTSNVLDAGGGLHAGENDVELLYENKGYPNGGPAMEKLAGVTALRVASTTVQGQPIVQWRMRVVDGVKKRPEIATEFADGDWKQVKIDRIDSQQLQPNQAAVYRATIDVTKEDLHSGKTVLAVSRMDDNGWVHVNGKRVGEGHSWEDSYLFDASKQLHVGKNVIAIVVKNDENGGGLGAVTWTTADKLDGGGAGLSFGLPEGVTEQWYGAEVSGAGWTKATLPEAASDEKALLTWHRLAFELPEKKAGVWVPWSIRVHFTGNGFIYLNGHGIGRVWQAGKQTDYYLPECWLNFGPGKKNVVTLSLRPVDKGAAVESAEVIPYTVYAEKR